MSTPQAVPVPHIRSLSLVVRDHVEYALRVFQGDRESTSRALHITMTQLSKLMREYRTHDRIIAECLEKTKGTSRAIDACG